MSGNMMIFPETWEEFERDYGFTDTEQIYTNGSRLMQSSRVEQWLEHIGKPKGKWIETKEKMPNDYDWVIAVVREIDTGFIWLPRVMEYRKGLNDWLFQNGRGWLSDEINKGLEVVAWCPLPKPYTADMRGEKRIIEKEQLIEEFEALKKDTPLVLTTDIENFICKGDTLGDICISEKIFIVKDNGENEDIKDWLKMIIKEAVWEALNGTRIIER